MELDETKWERARDHAWRYFDVHAGQRMAMFNFFIVLSGLILTGIAGSLQAGPKIAVIGIFLGLLLALLAFVFWKIDQRAAFLVKHAEEAQAAIESMLLPDKARLFSKEPEVRAGTKGSGFRKPWTFGKSLRVTFSSIAVAGLCGAGLCFVRAIEVLAPVKTQQQLRIGSNSVEARKSIHVANTSNTNVGEAVKNGNSPTAGPNR